MHAVDSDLNVKVMEIYPFLHQTDMYASFELLYSVALAVLLFVYNFPLYTFIRYELGVFGMLRILRQFLDIFYLVNFAFFLLLAYNAKGGLTRIKELNVFEEFFDAAKLVFTVSLLVIFY